MNASSPSSPAGKKMVLWVIWISLFSSLFMYRAFLGGETGESSEEGLNPLAVAMLVGPLAISVIIRWGPLAKVRDFHKALVLSIVGIAIAESLVFFGLFLFPAYETIFFLAGVFGVAQYIPVYANRLSSAGPGARG